jgi:transposase
VPDAATQEQRGLLRTRKQLVRERSSHVQRLQKTAIIDVMGLSGRAMIEALVAGETDPATLAGLAHRRIKMSPETLRAA